MTGAYVRLYVSVWRRGCVISRISVEPAELQECSRGSVCGYWCVLMHG